MKVIMHFIYGAEQHDAELQCFPHKREGITENSRKL